jgi:hypothetical protein
MFLLEKFAGRYFFTPKKAGAQTEEANLNAGVAAAEQIVDFFEEGITTSQSQLKLLTNSIIKFQSDFFTALSRRAYPIYQRFFKSF